MFVFEIKRLLYLLMKGNTKDKMPCSSVGMVTSI
jgi:hypothetical protein